MYAIRSYYAVSRFDIGVVIASGLGIGTLFTLFVVPAVYVMIARVHHAEGEGATPQAKRRPATAVHAGD